MRPPSTPAVGCGHAIIGCGRVAPNHVDAVARLPGWSVSWVCDVVPGRARAFGREHGVTGHTDDVDDVLRDGGVTSVSIATGHDAHHGLTRRALLAGKHVLVEKPLALTRASAEELVDLAHRRGVVLAVVSQHRFDPVARAVRQWLGEGLLGPLLYASVTVQAGRDVAYYTGSPWRGTWHGEGGSALINQGYHAVDMLVWLFGEVDEVMAHTARIAKPAAVETEDTACASLRFVDGGLGVVAVTSSGPTFWSTRIELAGSAGTVTFDLGHPNRIHAVAGDPELVARADALRAVDREEPAPGIDYYGTSHRRQFANFAAAVDGTEPCEVDGTEGLRTLDVILRIYADARARDRSGAVLASEARS